MILVTGGTGFLGSHLLRKLVDSGEKVRGIYRRKNFKNIPAYLSAKVDWQPADLLDIASLEDSLEGIDEVFHCAGYVSFNPADKKELYDVNVTGTANLVNACLEKKVSKLIYTSSVAALGRIIPGRLIDENCEWESNRKNSYYASTKHEGEMEVWRGMAEGLPSIIVNPSILIGKSPAWDDAFARLIKKCHNGFPWYTEGVNGFVNVDDVAEAMLQLSQKNISGERFILNGDNWSYQQIFSTIHRYLNTNIHLKYAAPWMGEIIWRWGAMKGYLTGNKPAVTRETAKTARLKIYYDNRKVKEFLPQFEFISLEKTLEETCHAFLQSIKKSVAYNAGKHQLPD